MYEDDFDFNESYWEESVSDADLWETNQVYLDNEGADWD